MEFKRFTGRLTVWTSLALILLAGECEVFACAGDPPAKQKEFDAKVGKFVATYCINCHGPKKQSGDVSFHQFKSLADAIKGHTVWETAIDRVRGREMPPPKKPQPSDAERSQFIAFLEAELSTATCTSAAPAGRVTLRRLNRVEYGNTIRDLFGMDLKAEEGFPSDDVGYGFDNIGDVLSLSPLHMEKYLNAADLVVEKVFAREAKVKSTTRVYGASERDYRPTGRTEVLPDQQGRIIYDGAVSRTHKFEFDGEYSFKIRAVGTPLAGELPRFAFRVEGKEVGQFDVKPKERSAGRRFPAYEYTANVTAGERRFSLEFLNPKSEPAQESTKPKSRSIHLDKVEITGPLHPAPPEPTEGYKKLMVAVPNADTTGVVAARKVLRSFARRAFRRPATAKEISTLINLYNLAIKQGDGHDDAIKLALKGVLVSPQFLFKVEADPPHAKPGESYLVSEFELATRLSYFLWSSMPDEELLKLAEAGELRKAGAIEKQVRRMLKDDKSRALADNFAGQWLQTRSLRTVAIDPKLFPTYDDDLRRAMIEETMRFFDHVVHADCKITDFLDADYTFVNERLARHYGIKGVRGPEFRQVSLAGTHRAGVLTQASILTATSNPTRTSPVKRGKFLLENILGSPVPPPPPDVPALDDGRELKGSLRERLEQHRTNPSCATCHQRMDPPGLAFENFDAIGRWRDKDGKFEIDPSGTLADGKEFKNVDDLRRILKEKQDAFGKTLADRLLTYAIGRGLEAADRCSVDEIARATRAGEDRFSALVMAVVMSEPFQKRTAVKGVR